MKKKVSLSSEKFIEILTKNGEKPNALNDFFQILEDWGDSRNKITFYIMQSNTLDMGLLATYCCWTSYVM